MGIEDIFRAYDVRGKVPEELDGEVMERIGKALGTLLREEGEGKAGVGMDVRESSPGLKSALVRGLTSTGVDVVDAGLVPYGALLFHARGNSLPSAYVTASHLPKGSNGVKFAQPDGTGYTEEENMEVRERFFDEDFDGGEGRVEEVDVLEAYRGHISESVDIGDISVLMDPGNGAASVVAPDVLWDAGAKLEVLNGDEDGSFPGRESDVKEETLGELMEMMEGGDFDIGFAYDGDADRLAVVDDSGKLLSAEETAYIALEKLVETEDGPIVANVECSRAIEEAAERFGVDVVRTRVGHSYVFREVLQRGACIGVEYSGHIGIPKIFPLDDGIAASLYIAYVVSGMDTPLSERVERIPSYQRGRVSFDVPDSDKFEMVEKLADELEREYDNTGRMDGVRVEMDEGWVLIRASNTSPVIRMTLEAETEKDFEELKREFSGRIEDAIGQDN